MALKILPARQIPSAEHERGYFHIEVDADVSVADILTPAFWGHHAQRMKPGSLVDIVRRDGTLDMQIRVVETGKGFAKVRQLRLWEDEQAAAQIAEANAIKAEINDDDAATATLPDVYKITYQPKGKTPGFSVIYKPTDAKIAEGIALKPDAVRRALAHAKELGLDVSPPPAPVPDPVEEPVA